VRVTLTEGAQELGDVVVHQPQMIPVSGRARQHGEYSPPWSSVITLMVSVERSATMELGIEDCHAGGPTRAAPRGAAPLCLVLEASQGARPGL
jgi:hypothetical protein